MLEVKENRIHKKSKNNNMKAEDLEKIVIVGNPNVGKSVLFNRISGSYVTVSNYPGTTIEIDRGKCKIDNKYYEVIDSPGVYSLVPLTEDERIAKLILIDEKPKIVLHVVDAKNIKRMLPLTLQLIEANLPVILVINMLDEAEELGITIDFKNLEEKLGIPVAPIIATSGQGLDELFKRMKDYKKNEIVKVFYHSNLESNLNKIEKLLQSDYTISKRAISLLIIQGDEDMRQQVQSKENKRWDDIERVMKKTIKGNELPDSYLIRRELQRKSKNIVEEILSDNKVQKIGFKEKLSKAMIRPISGIPILLVVLYFGLYQFVGVLSAGNIVDFIEGRLFGEIIIPEVGKFMLNYVPFVTIQELLIGEYGIITMGLTYAIAIILPIIGTFFLIFSIIEDSGYLPRLALLIDKLFKKIGLSGRAVIPMVLGLGCDTMATIVTRTQETKRERIIATLLIALAVPCSAQLGVIFAILSAHPGSLLLWASVVLSNFILIGFLTSRILPGEKPSFYMELPPLRLPRISNILSKTYTRIIWYLKEVLPLFILVSVLIWGFRSIGLFQFITGSLEPIVGLIGLPEETAHIFIFGFFRRDYGMAGLYEIQSVLTGVQLTVAAVTLTLFIPCIAQFLMMIKERGIKIAFSIFGFILFFAFGVGFILNKFLISLGVQL